MLWKAFSTSLKPDFSKLTSAGLLYALGQSFFALSLGGYSHADLCFLLGQENQSGPVREFPSAMNISVSIMAGLTIFPAMSAFSIQSEGDQACSLSSCLNSLTRCLLEPFFYIPFPLAFPLFATVASSVVMLEINVGNITNQDNRKRAKWSAILGILTFDFGIPSALSYGVMADVHIFGKTFFDAMDFLVSNLLMPFGALPVTFTGYIFKKAHAKG